jgi:choline dehydrogenase-like flavoprotein
VRLKSRDPCVGPRIDYNILSNPSDRRRLIEAVKLARHIARTRPLADLIECELSPGIDASDDEALANHIEANLDTYHHGTSTAPMSGDRNPRGVVDATGRVYGVESLRVVDASIIPEIPTTPRNLTTIMLAEPLALASAQQVALSAYVPVLGSHLAHEPTCCEFAPLPDPFPPLNVLD